MGVGLSAGVPPPKQSYIKASNTDAGDYFGYNVGISGDGSNFAFSAYAEASNARGVGGNQAHNSAPFAGAVYVF